MKKTNLVVLLFAAMTLSLTSCGKDDFEKGRYA